VKQEEEKGGPKFLFVSQLINMFAGMRKIWQNYFVETALVRA